MLFLNGRIFAQDTTSSKSNLTISGYLEAYYSYDFNNPANNSKPSFIYNFNRNNEVNINLGFIKASYETEKVRAHIVLGTGTYMNANYASEPGVLKNIFEANGGVKISKKNNLWVDAGIFSSHIGFESAIGSSCWNLMRSIVADNTPYYESGAKISYTSKNEKWFLSALLLNGWQHIERPNYNTTPAFGVQATFTPSANATINYSNFIGNDKPDSAKQMRYYNNFYGIFQLNKLIGLTIGFDYGLQQKAKGSSGLSGLYAPVVVLKISPDEKNSIALRGEYYSDRDSIIVSAGTPDGFKIFGASLNYDRQIIKNAFFRIELRDLMGKDDYFTKHNNSLSKNDIFLTTSLSISF
jgi:hypothetical protein